MMPSDFKVCV